MKRELLTLVQQQRRPGRAKRNLSLVNGILELYVNGYTYSEIASRMNVLIYTVADTLRAARKGTYDSECE